MGLLDELTNGGQAQQDYQDFVERYDQGAPYDNISADEAKQRHDQLAQDLSPEQYGHAAEGALGNLSEDDRAQIGEQLADQAQSQGVGGDQVTGAQQGDPSSWARWPGAYTNSRRAYSASSSAAEAVPGPEPSPASWPTPHAS